MRELKSVFKAVNWLRVFWLVTGFSSVLSFFGFLGLLVCYFPLVDVDIFGPLFYCGLSLGMCLFLSLMSSVCYDDMIEFRKLSELLYKLHEVFEKNGK